MGAYGVDRGPQRRESFDFLVLNRIAPGYYGCEFLEDIWERVSADYMLNIMEGVRRLLPYLGKTAPVAALRKIALTPVEGRRTFWREETTFRLESKRGFWMRTAIRELQMKKAEKILNWLCNGIWPSEGANIEKEDVSLITRI